MWFIWSFFLSKVGRSFETFLKENGPAQPFLLCVRERKNSIQNFYNVLDQKVIPCTTQTAVAALTSASRHILLLLCPMMRHCATSTHSSRPPCMALMLAESSVKNIRERILHRVVWRRTHLWLEICSHVTFASYTTQVVQCYLDIWSFSMVCTQEGIWTVEYGWSVFFLHIKPAQAALISSTWRLCSDLVSNFEFKPVATVGASVLQPVNADPPVTVTTHIPIEKKANIRHKQLCYCSSASLRSSWKYCAMFSGFNRGTG